MKVMLEFAVHTDDDANVFNDRWGYEEWKSYAKGGARQLLESGEYSVDVHSYQDLKRYVGDMEESKHEA